MSKGPNRCKLIRVPTWDMVPDAVIADLAKRMQVPYQVSVSRLGPYGIPFASWVTAKKYSLEGDVIYSVKGDPMLTPVPRIYLIRPANYSFFV
ncbi:hypothetical protein [Sigmofec virus UA08Rod_5448]|uniref:Uncharacterized protein n=1 Tax=Sigmofec virus UA08Rod_5448 TaxID=2929425 RepID=A0A976N1T4_9VIRU|nr:hypothetical protein [Sigmofec virus UA08Rod_5448]